MTYRDPMIQAEHDLRADAAEVRERHAPLAPLPKERPILFSSAMVRAILAGTKTQTRRVIKAEHLRGSQTPDDVLKSLRAQLLKEAATFCPYGQPGDRLWVRETWAPNPLAPAPDRTPYVLYRANGDGDKSTKWKPSIFMRRHSSRLLLEIVEVRVERLLEISETDAIAEGVRTLPAPQWRPAGWRETYWQLWDDINGRDASKSNPWTWAISFRRVL